MSAPPTARTPRTRRIVLVALAVLAAGCSGGDDDRADDDGDAGTDGTVIATVGERQVTREFIADLLEDPAYRSYAQLTDEPPALEDLATSGAGRTALGIVIQELAIETELERRGLEPTEEQIDEARRLLDPVDAEPGTTVKAVHGPFSDRVSEVVGTALARYRLLDDVLRDSDPDDAAQRADLLERAPSITDRYCGPLIIVPVEAEEAIREQIDLGTPLESAADRGVEVIVQTEGPEDRCGVVAGAPDGYVNLLLTLEEGDVGLGPARLPDGRDVLYVTQLESRDRVTGAEADAAARTTLESFRDNGFATFQRLLYVELEPDIDPVWGTWEPQFGLFPPDGSLPFETLDAPATTTSTAPPTTTAPPTPPTTTAPPAPTSNQFDPGPSDLEARGQAALVAGVPVSWRNAVPVRMGVIGGSTSLSYSDGRLQMGSAHLSGPWDRLVAIVAHEFGHHVAFRYGTQATLGAAPAGWPVSGSPPVERWADCVSRTFTFYPLGSHGMSACVDPSLSWTQGFLNSGPASHPRTG